MGRLTPREVHTLEVIGEIGLLRLLAGRHGDDSSRIADQCVLGLERLGVQLGASLETFPSGDGLEVAHAVAGASVSGGCDRCDLSGGGDDDETRETAASQPTVAGVAAVAPPESAVDGKRGGTACIADKSPGGDISGVASGSTATRRRRGRAGRARPGGSPEAETSGGERGACESEQRTQAVDAAAALAVTQAPVSHTHSPATIAGAGGARGRQLASNHEAPAVATTQVGSCMQPPASRRPSRFDGAAAARTAGDSPAAPAPCAWRQCGKLWVRSSAESAADGVDGDDPNTAPCQSQPSSEQARRYGSGARSTSANGPTPDVLASSGEGGASGHDALHGADANVAVELAVKNTFVHVAATPVRQRRALSAPLSAGGVSPQSLAPVPPFPGVQGHARALSPSHGDGVATNAARGNFVKENIEQVSGKRLPLVTGSGAPASLLPRPPESGSKIVVTEERRRTLEDVLRTLRSCAGVMSAQQMAKIEADVRAELRGEISLLAGQGVVADSLVK